MTLVSSIKLALASLKLNKKRAFMTMLGVIIGVGSVIVIMSVGAGAQSLILNELSSFGSNLFGVMPGAAADDGPPASVMGITVTTLKLKEIEDIRKIPHVESVTAYVRGVDMIYYANQKTEATYVGTTEDLIQVEGLEMAEGRFYDKYDSNSLSRVVVLGHEVKQELFGDGSAVGEVIKIEKQNFKVIGVMDEMGTMAFENKDTQIYIPIKTAQKILLGINHISMVRGKVDDSANLEFVLEEVRQAIRENHNIDDPKNDDFTARSIAQALDVVGSITDGLRFFLVAIAAISLLVGGVGIMNIMLVNVAERTNEIGLRKAVGATKANISKQFLIEATTITMYGGVIGIIGGVILSWLVAVVANQLGYNWNLVITIPSILLGLGVSAGVGIIFGFYPARKAAEMEPVEALRVE